MSLSKLSRAGREVIAIARYPRTLTIEHLNFTKTLVIILDAQAVERHLAGVDAVVSTVEVGTAKTHKLLHSKGTRNLLAGMSEHDLYRLIVMSSEATEYLIHQRLLKLWTALPRLQEFLGASYDHVRRMDVALSESRALWTTTRAPRFRSAHGKAGCGLGIKPLPSEWVVTVAGMTNAMLDIIERDNFDRQQSTAPISELRKRSTAVHCGTWLVATTPGDLDVITSRSVSPCG